MESPGRGPGRHRDRVTHDTDEEELKNPKKAGMGCINSVMPSHLRRLSNKGSSIDDLIDFQGIQDFFLQQGFGQSP